MKTPFILANEPIEIGVHSPTMQLNVRNTGDRPVQVGSMYHFFEANRVLDFDRERAWGQHLNVPTGASVRFEPGDEKDVELIGFRGKRVMYGFAGLVNGPLDADGARDKAIEAARRAGFKGA